MEIDGIPRSITQDQLENTVCKIFNSVPNIQCQPEHLEACHRITARSATTIIKFKNRKMKEKIVDNRKKITAIDTESLGIGSTRIYLNNNLTPKHKELAFNCHQLKRDKLIEDAWNSNANVKVRGKDGLIHNIEHELDLYRLFPDYGKFTFHIDFLANAEEYEEYIEYDGDSLSE